MIPTKLILSNFTSYGEDKKELDFSRFKLAAISGLNGSGKSSLLDAITWCVWGQSRASDSSDDLIHKGADKMFVEFSFEFDGNVYTIKRQRIKKSGGSTNLELWSGSTSSPQAHNLTEGTIKTTQEKIINLLHLTYETFTNSSFIRQGHADEFTTKGPTDRKRILSDILGLSHYDKLEEKAKDKVKDIQIKLQLYQYQILEIEAEISQKDLREKELIQAKQKVGEVDIKIKALDDNLKSLQKNKESLNLIFETRKKMEENLVEQNKELAQILSQGKERAQRINELEKYISSYKSLDEKFLQKERLEDDRKTLIHLNEERLKLENHLKELKGNLALKSQKKEQLTKEQEKFKNELYKLSQKEARCPTCGQLIDIDRKHQIVTQLKKQINELEYEINKIQMIDEEKELKETEIKIFNINPNQKKLTEIENLLTEINKLQKEKELFLQHKATLESEKKIRDELRELFKNKADQVKKLEEELVKLPKIGAEINNLNTKVQQTERDLQTLRIEQKDAQNLLGRAEELITRAQQLEKLYKQKSEEKSKFAKEKGIFEELSLAFGKKGIQTMIIETAIPQIEDETNKLLDKLTDGRMRITLVTQKETKTKISGGEKGIIETLDIIISDEMGERPYEMYSGGEAFRVNFAIRLAISKLLTHRAGAKLQFLVIDEGFGSQDAPGRARLVEVIDMIKNDFEKILVITHIEELKEEFPTRIEVSKGPNGSFFEVVGI